MKEEYKDKSMQELVKQWLKEGKLTKEEVQDYQAHGAKSWVCQKVSDLLHEE